MRNPTRRHVVLAGSAAASLAGLARIGPAFAGETESHGLSSFGDLKYPPDFRHFDYVNPKAPKGGSLVVQIKQTLGNQNFDTFNTLNVYTFKGDGAAGMPMTFDSLMAGTADEPDAQYGLVARAVRVSADKLTYRFLLRPEARFHNGTRLTAKDVAFSLSILKAKGHPYFRAILAQFEAAEAEADDIVRVTLSPRRSRVLTCSRSA